MGVQKSKPEYQKFSPAYRVRENSLAADKSLYGSPDAT